MSSAAPPVLVPPDIQRTTFHTLQKASRAAQQEQHTWWLLYFFLAMFAIAWGTLQLSLRLPERRPTQAPVNWALLAHHPEQLLPTHPAPTSLQALDDPTAAYLEAHPHLARTIAFQEWETRAGIPREPPRAAPRHGPSSVVAMRIHD